MPHRTAVILLAAALAVVAAASVGASSPRPVETRWKPLLSVPGIADVAGPRSDGRYVITAGGRLWLLRIGGEPTPFARGPHGYSTAPEFEPYLAVSRKLRMEKAGCSFRRDDVYAVEQGADPGVIRISRDGVARRFADLPGSSGRGGITFDLPGGRFGGRLLVAGQSQGADSTDLWGFDCAGGRRHFVSDGPRAEGGIAIAPRSFGRFGGTLIAPDELTGSIYAFGPRGGVRLVARPRRVAAGPDAGIESLGFAPSFRRFDLALLTDRPAPGNPFPGHETLLAARAGALWRAGVRRGDLLAVAEGDAITVRLRCHRRCRARRVAAGPLGAHAEGHVEFAVSPRG